ncbi:hypothetical protein OAT16_00355 [Prolixibacteraceae bacterium]|nr:hypothetical protein [Prolixibacteraceae bacterium]
MKRIIVLSLVTLLSIGCSKDSSPITDDEWYPDGKQKRSAPWNGYVLIENVRERMSSKIEISNAYLVRRDAKDCLIFTNYDYRDVIARLGDHDLFQCLFYDFDVERNRCAFDRLHISVVRGGLDVFQNCMYGKRSFGYDKCMVRDRSISPSIQMNKFQKEGSYVLKGSVRLKDFYDQMKLSIEYVGEVIDLRSSSRFRLGTSALKFDQPFVTPSHPPIANEAYFRDIFYERSQLMGIENDGGDLFLSTIHLDGKVVRLRPMKELHEQAELKIVDGYLYEQRVAYAKGVERIDFYKYPTMKDKRLSFASSRIAAYKDRYYVLSGGVLLKADVEGKVLKRQYDNFLPRCLASSVGLIWSVLCENDRIYLVGLDKHLEFVRAYELIGLPVMPGSFQVRSLCAYKSSTLLMLDGANRIYQISVSR